MSNLMDDAVAELCHSLENDLSRWEIVALTLRDKKTGIEYWVGTGSESAITETWDGYSTAEVFSHEQGNMIKKSYEILCDKKASIAQQKVIKSMTKNKSKKWWKF